MQPACVLSTNEDGVAVLRCDHRGAVNRRGQQFNHRCCSSGMSEHTTFNWKLLNITTLIPNQSKRVISYFNFYLKS